MVETNAFTRLEERNFFLELLTENKYLSFAIVLQYTIMIEHKKKQK